MKGLILSGGKGTRLRPITYTSAKQLVPVANKPVLFYTIENLVEAGITDIGIVVGDTREEIKRAVGDGSQFGAKVTYVEQDQPLGLAHAVMVAASYLRDDSFCMYLGDNMIEPSIKPLVAGFLADETMNSQILLKKVPNPQAYGVAELEDGRIVRLVEKPREPKSDLALVGIYMFDHNVFEAVHAIKPSWRGELEITDAIQYLVEHGYVVRPHVVQGWWIDTGKQEDMLEANRLVLEKLPARNDGYVDADSRIDGKVIIEEGAEVINSVIRGPAIIGQHTRIVNSYIGPFSAIYHHVLVEHSEIEHSIILENSQIIDLPARLEDSLIGRNVELGRSPIKPKAYKMTLGDNSKVGVLLTLPNPSLKGRGDVGAGLVRPIQEKLVKHLIVTGGAGFIGSNFVRYMLGKYPDYTITVLDKLTYAGNLANLSDVERNPRYRFVQGDIADAEAVAQATEAQGCDAIINFAAESHVDRSILEPDAFIKTDVYGTYVLLEAGRRLGVERFVQISTDEVYGDVPAPRSSVEGDPLAPSSPYSATKTGGELLALAYHRTYDLPVVVTRGSNNYGPYQFPEKLIPLFITNVLEDKPVPVYGDGKQVRNWIHVLDHCTGIDIALHNGEAGQAYNVGGAVEVTNIQITTTILRLLGKPDSLIKYVKDRPGHDRRYSLDSSRLKALGWQPQYNFEQGLQQTVEWYAQHPEWWQPLKSGEYLDYYQRQYGQRVAS